MRSFPRPRRHSIGVENDEINLHNLIRGQGIRPQNVYRFNYGEINPRSRIDSIFNRNRNRVAPELPHILDQLDENSTGRNYGKYKVICRRRGVLGPGKYHLMLSIVVMFLFLSLQCILHKELTLTLGSFVPYGGYVLFFLTLCFMLSTAFTDPGIIPRNISLTRHMITNGDSWINRGFPPTYCRICRIGRPPRTYHCKQCDICIRRQDIHLVALGTCVGERNFRSYYFFNLFLNGLSIYVFITNCIYLSLKYEFEKANRRNETWSQYYSLAVINLIITMCLIALPQTGLLMLLYRFYLFAKDRTAREEFRIIFHGRRDVRFGNGIQKSFFQSLKEHLFPVRQGISYLGSSYMNHRDFESSGLGQWNWLDETPDYIANDFPFHYENQRFALNQWNPLDFEEEGEADGWTQDLRNANMAKRKAFLSMPMIHDGSLRNLPTARHKLPKRAKFKHIVESKLKHHQEFLELPKAVADNQFYQANKVSGSLSLGDIPKTAWNQTTENEMLQQARANQIVQVIDLLRVRDRVGLIRLGRRINIGALLGIDNLDPEFLQIIELNNNGIPVVRGRQRGILRLGGAQGLFRRPQHPAPQNQRNQIGIHQMIAAGLVSQQEGTMIREMIPGREGRIPNLHMPAIPPPHRQRVNIPNPFQVAPPQQSPRIPLQTANQAPTVSAMSRNQPVQVPNPVGNSLGSREIRINIPRSSSSGNPNRERAVQDINDNYNNNQNEPGPSSSISENNRNDSSGSSRRGIVFQMNRARRRGR